MSRLSLESISTAVEATVTRALLQYFNEEAGPRFFDIIFKSDFIIAALAGAGFALWGENIGLADAKIGDVTTALLTYAAIAFGFCLSGLTLALVLPDREFAVQLASSKVSSKSLNSYSNLMFIFSWTAFIHWLVVISAIVAFAFCGSDEQILPPCPTVLRRGIVGLLIFLSIYAILRFLVTLITLSQVGHLYIVRLLSKPTSEPKKSS
jgi:hypothetical protein